MTEAERIIAEALNKQLDKAIEILDSPKKDWDVDELVEFSMNLARSAAEEIEDIYE